MYQPVCPKPGFASTKRSASFAWIAAGLLLAALILIQIPACAQNITGSISGVVADSSGAVVPGARVVLKNEATGITRDTLSNGSGLFNFAAIQPASYTVTITAAGFTTWAERGIALTQGGVITIPNIVLQIGTTTSEVQVIAANDVAVPTDNGQASTTLNQHMISQLTIAGRDAAELIKIMPGMGNVNGLNQGSGFDPTTGTASNTGPIGRYSANGSQPYGSMTMTSDGANLLDPGNQGTQTANINTDQTQEVTLLTSAFGAEFAKGPVTFQAIGKSGSAQFHGQGYFYARNGIMNAEDSYQKSQGIGKPADHYYYPGGDFGGPVLIPGTSFNRNRDKLFFYAAYEYMAQQQAGALYNYFIPTKEMMGGNFSPTYLSSLGPDFKNNFSQYGDLADPGKYYPGGIIPTSALDPNARAIWNLMPQPNADPTANSAGVNYRYLLSPPQNRWELRLRGDYSISENTKLFFSWNRQDESDQDPINVWWWMSGALPYPSNMIANQVSNVYSANLTHVFSPTLTNEFIFADATFLNPINLANPAAVDPSKLGFQMQGIFSQSGYTPQIPNVFSGWTQGSPGAFAGYSVYTFGIPGFSAELGKLSQTPSISDNVTKVWGSHTIKAGVYWDYARNQETTNAGPEGGVQGAAGYFNWGAQSTGNPIADFVSGRITQFEQDNGAATADFKYYQYSAYVQDAWKANRRLTLTYGLRLDHMGQWAPNDKYGLAVWDPATYDNTSAAGAWTGLVWHSIDSSVPMSGFPSRLFFPAPRVGAAYDLFGNGKTVIRGGFGVYRYQIAYNTVSQSAYTAPLGYEHATTQWGCCLGWDNFASYVSLNPAKAGLGSAVSNVLTMGDNKTPYSQTYNITLSQRVPWSSVAEFQYSGNRSHDMLLDNNQENLQNVPVGTYFKPDPVTGVYVDPSSPSFNAAHYYPYANYGSKLQLVTHGSYSNYNAFIASWQKQTGRMTFTANYTFSKALGIRDGETDNGLGQGTLMDPFNMQNNYGVLAFDHTHIINAAYVINLPSPVHGNRMFGGAVNGWELSGITQWQSGAPIQPNTNGALNVQYPGLFVTGGNVGYSQQAILGTQAYPETGVYPVVICDPRKGVPSGSYFNPACFAPETTIGQQGTLIWPYIKGPAYFNSDLSLYKNFNFKERQNVQFRIETFNFMNHPLPQFNTGGTPDANLSFNDGNNGLAMTNQNPITTGAPAHTVGRRVVMLSLKYNF